MPVEIVEIQLGLPNPRKRIYRWGVDGQSAVGTYLEGLLDSRHSEAAKLLKLFRIYAQQGEMRNPEHFKDVEGHKPLYEFKAHGPRIYCILHGTRVVLLEGDTKTSDKSKSRNNQAIARAERRAEAYLEADTKGTLVIK